MQATLPHSSWELEVALQEKAVLSTADQRCWSITKRSCRECIPFELPLICKEVKYVTLALYPSSALAQGLSMLNRNVHLVQLSRNPFFLFSPFSWISVFFSSQLIQLSPDGYDYHSPWLFKKKDTPFRKYLSLYFCPFSKSQQSTAVCFIYWPSSAAFHILEKNIYVLLMNLVYFLSGNFCTAI